MRLKYLSVTAGAFGGALGGAGAGLPHSAKFNRGVEIVGNAMEKLGEIVGLNASKSKLVVGQIPDAATGVRLEMNTVRVG